MERILEGGFEVYVELMLEEDLYRSVRGGYYTKEWKEISMVELNGQLHGMIRRIGMEFQSYVKEKGWLEEDNDSKYMESSMKIYGSPCEWKKTITKYKKGIVEKTKRL